MPRIFAHRGSSAAYAENTRAAYLQGLADDADGLECDVHLSADGVVVCHHDATLGRTSNGSGELREHTLQQLRELDYSSWKGAEIPAAYGEIGEQLCTLTELLDIALGAGRPVELAVETKHQLGDDPRLEAAVIAALVERGFDPATRTVGNVTVSFMSFNPLAVRRLLELVPASGVCQLLENNRSTPLLAQVQDGAFEMLDAGGVGIGGPGVDEVRRHTARVRGWIAAGMMQRVWTVDSLSDALYLMDQGVTELTSNVPAQLRRELMAQSFC